MVRTVDARVVELSRLTHDVRRLVLEVRPEGAFDFLAGQHAKVEFPLPDGTSLVRDYSIASSPAASARDGTIEFHIRDTSGGRFARLIESGSLAVGTALRVKGPYGHAYLRAHSPLPIVMIAGGTGLAPILAIAESAVDAAIPAPIRVYVGMRDERDVYGEARLSALAARHPEFRFDIVLSEPSSPTSRRCGLVTDAVAADWPSLAGTKIYLAGPPPMTQAATVLLAALGALGRDIHTDASADPAPNGAPTIPGE